jgi:hypothetical protein
MNPLAIIFSFVFGICCGGLAVYYFMKWVFGKITVHKFELDTSHCHNPNCEASHCNLMLYVSAPGLAPTVFPIPYQEIKQGSVKESET